jgi:hypothetical protein
MKKANIIFPELNEMQGNMSLQSSPLSLMVDPEVAQPKELHDIYGKKENTKKQVCLASCVVEIKAREMQSHDSVPPPTYYHFSAHIIHEHITLIGIPTSECCLGTQKPTICLKLRRLDCRRVLKMRAQTWLALTSAEAQGQPLLSCLQLPGKRGLSFAASLACNDLRCCAT